MENSSQNDNENNLTPNLDDDGVSSDINFEDVDIEKVQAELMHKLSGEPEDVNSEDDSEDDIKLPQIPIVSSNIKKYVIYVDSDNIKFMEGLSVDERREVINKILRQQDTATQNRLKRSAQINKSINTFIAVVTFIVFLPIMFIILNKSIQVTIHNYSQASSNFSKLYKDHGKIQSLK